MPPPVPPPVPPGYELLGELGRGGMGVVYKAVQTRAKRPVALKMILSTRHASLEQRLRFQIEAEAIARFQHPHIVQLHEVGEHDGQPFFSLELCAGGSLSQQLREQPLDPTEAAVLLEKLARAMHYAHSRGVVHRDLKPANVLLTAEGEPKITDFGLAKCLDSDSDVSRTGAVMGTPAYMAPEQAEGKGHAIDPRTDVYALGAILYECLTGEPLFRGHPLLVLANAVNSEPVPPSQLATQVPRDLETICLKCLRKEQDQRYGSAAELAERLRSFLEGKPIPDRPVSVLERAAKWVRRRPAVAALSATLVLVTLLGGALLLVSAAEQRRLAESATLDAERARTALVNLAVESRARDAANQAALAEGRARELQFRTALYAHAIRDTQQALDRDELGRAEQLLEECPPELRGWEWDHLRLRCGRTCATLGRHRWPVRGVGQGSTVNQTSWFSWAAAVDGSEAEVNFYSPAGRPAAERKQSVRTLTLTGHRAPVRGLDISQAGTHIVTCASRPGSDPAKSFDEVLLWDARTGAILRALPAPANVRSVAFSRDGALVAAGSHKGLGPIEKVIVWDLMSGRQVFARPGAHGPVVFLDPAVPAALDTSDLLVALQPSGGRYRLFAMTSPEGNQNDPKGQLLEGLSVPAAWDPETGKQVFTVQQPQPLRGIRQIPLSLALSRRGERICVGFEDRNISPGNVLTNRGRVKTWDGTTGALLIEEVLPLPAEVVAVEQHDGVVWTAVTQSAATRLTWSALEPARSEPASPEVPLFRYLFSAEPQQGLLFQEQGHGLLTAGFDGVVRRWETGRVPPYSRAWSQDNPIRLALSPDGKVLALGTGTVAKYEGQPTVEYGRLRLIDLPSDRVTLEVEAIDRDLRDARGQRLEEVSVNALGFAADGTRLAFLLGNHLGVVDSPAAAPRLGWRKELATPGRCVAFSSDGTRIVTVAGNNAVQLWDAASGEAIGTLGSHTGAVRVAYHPTGRRLVTSGTSVRVWDASTGAALAEYDIAGAVTYSPDGKYLVRSEGAPDVWEADSGAPVTGTEQRRAAWPLRRTLVPGGLRRFALHDVATGQRVADFPGQARVVTFSQDGKRLVVAEADRVVFLDAAELGWKPVRAQVRTRSRTPPP